MPTKQTAAVNGANLLFSLMKQLQNFRAQVNDFVTQYNDNNWGAIWNAWPTAALATDGSLGTADGTPNTLHPIDTRIAALANLASPNAANDLTSAVTALQAFQSFLTNAAVSTANRNAVIDLFQQG